MAAEAFGHADLVSDEDGALGLELFTKLGGHVAQLGPVAKEAKHSQTVAQRASRPDYCTVTFAVNVHTGVVLLPTKLA
jgi:hypothetical protein